MKKNLENIAKEVLNQLTAPHIGLTFYKFKAKAVSIFKSLNIDITIDQFITLKLLSSHKNIQQQDLAQLLHKSKSNFSKMLDNLENKQYLQRKIELKGKRIIKQLNITTKGKALVEKLTGVAEKIHLTALSGISEEELNSLKKTLGKIRNNLEKDFKINI